MNTTAESQATVRDGGAGARLIEHITFLRDHRVFKAGDRIEFRGGVNLLVGDQGAGKSTLISLLSRPQKHTEMVTVGIGGDRVQTRSFDFEKDNIRTDNSALSRHEWKAGLAGAWSSHGQFVNAVLRTLGEERGTCFIMDEPDMALSIRSIRALVNTMRESVAVGNQLICSGHNPELILSFPEVYSLEHRRWMPSLEFVAAHRQEQGRDAVTVSPTPEETGPEIQSPPSARTVRWRHR